MAEEVVAEQWEESCPEEIVVGSEEAVGLSGEQASTEDLEIPLPTDQDEYTAARPYPCDFCSRRFRKKANLMNHMVAHQTDRPHGCNLCGVRYIRKCDLMNHLKVHAFIPDQQGGVMEDEEEQMETPSDSERYNRRPDGRRRGGGGGRRRKRQTVKQEYEVYGEEAEEEDDGGQAGSSRGGYYDQAEMVDVKSYEYIEGGGEAGEIKYPVTDRRKPFVCQHCGVGKFCSGGSTLFNLTLRHLFFDLL